jgi:hypothetical protein
MILHTSWGRNVISSSPVPQMVLLICIMQIIWEQSWSSRELMDLLPLGQTRSCLEKALWLFLTSLLMLEELPSPISNGWKTWSMCPLEGWPRSIRKDKRMNCYKFWVTIFPRTLLLEKDLKAQKKSILFTLALSRWCSRQLAKTGNMLKLITWLWEKLALVMRLRSSQNITNPLGSWFDDDEIHDSN